MPKAVLLLFLFTFATTSQAASLQARLEGLAKRHNGKVAFYAKNLKTGDSVAVDADRPVKTASVIKLALFLEAFRQIDAGKRRLDETVVLDEKNRSLGSGVLGFLHSGLKLTLEDTLLLMMVVSDNTATNLLIDVFPAEAVNQYMDQLGATHTRLLRKIQVASPQVNPAEQKVYGIGKTTAREAALLIEQVDRCRLSNPALCRRMLEIMVNQQYRNMVPRFIETKDASEVTSAIADKIGALNRVRNDVALVYTYAGPIVISAFTYDNQDQRWSCENSAELLISQMSKLVVDAWSPRGVLPHGPPQLEQLQSPDAGFPGRTMGIDPKSSSGHATDSGTR